MVRNKHHEDSTDGQEGDNDLEAMISSFGLQEVFLRTALQGTLFKMDFISLAVSYTVW